MACWGRGGRTAELKLNKVDRQLTRDLVSLTVQWRDAAPEAGRMGGQKRFRGQAREGMGKRGNQARNRAKLCYGGKVVESRRKWSEC
jgi:hypothetical protein